VNVHEIVASEKLEQCVLGLFSTRIRAASGACTPMTPWASPPRRLPTASLHGRRLSVACCFLVFLFLGKWQVGKTDWHAATLVAHARILYM
jgi:hypothetical protein